MKKETLKSLIDQQGLPLDVRIKDWPEKCYFNAQEISSGKVFGCIM